MADSSITKNALAAALKNLMKTTPFEKISVSDICKACGMNRKSFYYHFRDKYDLVNWIFYVEFLGKMDLKSYRSGWDAIQDVCDLFYADKEFYKEALRIEGQNSFHDYAIETIRPILNYYIKYMYEDRQLQGFFIDFFVDAFLRVIMRWLSEGMQMSSEEFVRNLKGVFIGLSRQIIRDEEGDG